MCGGFIKESIKIIILNFRIREEQNHIFGSVLICNAHCCGK